MIMRAGEPKRSRGPRLPSPRAIEASRQGKPLRYQKSSGSRSKANRKAQRRGVGRWKALLAKISAGRADRNEETIVIAMVAIACGRDPGSFYSEQGRGCTNAADDFS